jgi:hypothetical protein
MLKVAAVLALALCLAAPAFAEIKLNGYFRTQATAQNSVGGVWNHFGLTKDAATTTFIDQRLRMKLTNQLNDKVKFVYYGEVDTPWGLPSRGGIGGGGRQGADAVNIETKNVYLNFLAGDWNLTFGIQNMADNVAAIVINNDVAGMTAKTKLGATDLTLRYAKLYENDASAGLASSWNDESFYAVQTGFTLSDNARVGFDVLYFDDNLDLAESEQLYLSLDGKFKLGGGNLTGFILYGSQDYEGNPAISSDNFDGSNWAATAQFATKLDNGNFSVRAIYFADADKVEDILFADDHGTGFQFYKEGLMLFLTDIYYNNGTQGGLYKDAVFSGLGLSALTLKGNVGLDGGYYLKYAAGYFMANDDKGPSSYKVVEGKSMGTEFDLMFGKKINEKVDLSIRGAYAFLGDFYDNWSGTGMDADNPWKAVAMINVGF